MTTLRALIAAGLVVATFGIALAKLPPAPPMDDKAKAAAEEKKTKDAAAAEAAKMQQAKAEDRVAARYIAEQKAKGKTVTPQMGRRWSPPLRLRPQRPRRKARHRKQRARARRRRRRRSSAARTSRALACDAESSGARPEIAIIPSSRRVGRVVEGA